MITAIWIFLGIVLLAFIIVFVAQATGLFRTRAYKGKANKSTPEPGIDTRGGIVEDRLGTPDLHKKGFDPRGDDVGGNFSGTSNRGDTPGENRR
ncbi:MAG: hypothetical protein M3Y39_02950 [Chloroflexota bacterium]|nr:hypothetical protein [Chloroflexota bacterium]